MTVHATQNYFVSVSADKSWNFYDLSTGLCLAQVCSALETCWFALVGIFEIYCLPSLVQHLVFVT